MSEDDKYQSAISHKKKIKCSSWDYDTFKWKSTIIHEWNLVCDRGHLLKLTQQVTFFGLLCGVFLSGLISDRLEYIVIMRKITGIVFEIFKTYCFF